MAGDSYTVGTHDETGLPVVDFDHGRYGLGCKPRKLSAHIGEFPRAALPAIPEADWTDQDLRAFCHSVMDQSRSSSCNPHALIEAMYTAFALMGQERPELSPWAVYGWLTNGQDEGSSIPDALHLAKTVGAPLDSSVRQGDFSGQYPAAVKQEAARFRIEAANDLATWADLMTAPQRDQSSVIGIDIGAQFSPDAEGYLPDFRPSPEGVLGHAVSVQGKKKARGKWWALIQNHWTKQWGMDGFAYMPKSYWQPAFGAYAVRVVRIDPQSPTNPPAAV